METDGTATVEGCGLQALERLNLRRALARWMLCLKLVTLEYVALPSLVPSGSETALAFCTVEHRVWYICTMLAVRHAPPRSGNAISE